MKKIIFAFLLIALPSYAQLDNTIGKTKAQLSQIINGVTQPNKTWFENQIFQRLVEYNNAFIDRGVSSEDYATMLSLVTAALDSSWMVIIPNGEFNLADSLYLGKPILFQGMGRNTSRETMIDTVGPRINVTINNGQPAIIDTIPGMRLRDFALLADTSKNTGEGIRIRRDRQKTTVGNWHIDGVTIKDFKSHGIHVYAPDNNSVIMHNHVVSNRGWGLYAQASTGGASGKGLNMMTLFNRFLANDSGAVRLNSVAHTLWMGNGLLGTQNSMPLIQVKGTRGINQYDVWIANDVEGEAGGDDTRAPIFEYNNTRGTIMMGNRIGQPESGTADTATVATPAPAFAARGHVRSIMDIQNRYVGYVPDTDTVMVAYSGGTINYFGLGDRVGFQGKDIKTSGTGGYRYLDIYLDRDSLFASIDAGSPSPTFKGLYINPYVNSSVNFSARAASGKTARVYFWGHNGTAPDTLGELRTPKNQDVFQIHALEGDLELYSDSADVVINEQGSATMDFRVESDNQSNMLRVDAADNAVGIATGNPKWQLSFINSAPQLGMTDTDINLLFNSVSQAGDTAAIVLDASIAGAPMIKVVDNVGDTVFVIAANGGIIVGSGVTGLSQGAGTINAKGLYDDGVGVSDYVFEPEYNLMPIDSMKAFYEANKHLPTIPGREAWERKKPSIGELTNRLYETIEVQARYIAELHERLKKLEAER